MNNKYVHNKRKFHCYGNLYNTNTMNTISMDVLAKLCKALQCDIGDIIEYVGKGE